MTLTWVELRDFRSYRECLVKPDGRVNVLVGPNASGKSNFLEAVAYLAWLKSFRGVVDKALIRKGAERAVVRGEAKQQGRRSRVEVELERESGRKARLNDKPLRRVLEVLGHLRAVVFTPEDLDILKRGPARRRELLDELAVQLWPSARADQLEYQRVLRQRNALLRAAGNRVEDSRLDVWDTRLSQAGAKVVQRRARAAAVVSEWVPRTYGRLAGDRSHVEMKYEATWGGELGMDSETGQAQLIEDALVRARQRDKERRVTTVGPHRDDPSFFLDGKEARTHISQGEQRTLAVALRLAAHRAVVAETNELPLLLLDDVFSELDMSRARALADVLPDAQTFITTARDEEVPLEGRRWIVKRGEIR